jgi:hypothetical protein
MNKTISFQIQRGEIIGFAGYKGSGKTTLAKQIEQASRGVVIRMSFADSLKAVADCFLQQIGIDRPELRHEMLHGTMKELPVPGWEVTPRHILQTLGTEWGRECIHPDLWVILTMEKAKAYIKLGYGVIIDDVRKPNETAAIKALGGMVVLITCPGVERSSDHPSEELPPFDEEFVNDWGKA